MRNPLLRLVTTTLSAYLLAAGSAVPAQAQNSLLSALGGAANSSQLQNSLDGAGFIESIYKAADALDDYTFQYDSITFKHGSSENQQGKFYFKKPHLMRVEVTGGAKKGAVAALEKTGKVRGHLGGMLRGFKATLSPDNEMLRSPNGHPMLRSDFVSLYGYLRNMLKNGDHSLVTKEPVAQDQLKPAYILDIYDKQDALLKRIFVDPSSKMPVMWYDYTNGKLTTRTYWEGLRTNTGLSDKLFTM